MSETPTGGSIGTGGVNTPGDTGTTGNAADAAPVQSNPTDSSSVSDEQGVQAERTEETPTADHEGTGPGDDVDNLPPSNTTADVEDEVDGSDNA